MEENQIIETKEDIEIYDKEKIRSMIYEVRGKQVMLDSDVALLYNYETKKINQAVKRNIERFPQNFCFQLTENEFNCLRSQFVTLNKSNSRGQHRKYMPYAFTEQGIAMWKCIYQGFQLKNLKKN